MAAQNISRIMLIDDEAIDHVLCRRIFTRSGRVGDFIGFTKASDVIDYFKTPGTPPIDVILLDIRMPIMSGFDFLNAVEPHMPEDQDIPVIMMLTTSLSPTDKDRIQQYRRVRSYLHKPLTTEMLDRIIAEVHSAEIGRPSLLTGSLTG